MSETAQELAAPAIPPQPAPVGEKPKRKEEGSFVVFLLKLVGVILVLRIFVFSPFSIPSESMLPRIHTGDFVLATKWNYGFSNHSLPLGLAPFPKGRIFASQPERGDVVIFKAPPLDREDYIKRVIGLPGDEVQMIGGVLFINGIEVEKRRVADFIQPVDAGMLAAAKRKNSVTPCYALRFESESADGARVCRYPQFVETLPDGVSYRVLDFGMTSRDDTAPIVVPDGTLFLMGDNRDNSLDSRFEAEPGGGVGIVPQDNLVGRAAVMMWSTDGSSEWLKPWTWFSAARWSRIGRTF